MKCAFLDKDKGIGNQFVIMGAYFGQQDATLKVQRYDGLMGNYSFLTGIENRTNEKKRIFCGSKRQFEGGGFYEELYDLWSLAVSFDVFSRGEYWSSAGY